MLEGRLRLQGGLQVDALDMTSRLSTLRPLGSYRVHLEATPDGNSALLHLTTLRGGLQLQGNGQWIGGRLRFQGVAQAAPGRENALENLLNIIGRRDGPRSILRWAEPAPTRDRIPHMNRHHLDPGLKAPGAMRSRTPLALAWV